MFVQQTIILLTLIITAYCGYWEMRKSVLEVEKIISVGGNLSLSEDEKRIESFVMKLKTEDFKNFNESAFLPAQRFNVIKKQMENSKLFELIKRVPKGASLHTHILAAGNVDFIIQNLTYRENLYACTWNGKFKLKFLENNEDKTYNWSLVADLRRNDKNFDQFLRKQLTIGSTRNKNEAWTKLSNIFTTVYDFLTYKPVFIDYIEHVLKNFQDDKVYYVELRGGFMELYDFNTTFDKMHMLHVLYDVVQKFSVDNPDFLGLKYIYAPYRNLKAEELQDHKKMLEMARRKYPNLVIGFDLVGLEDNGTPLQNYADDLLKVDKNIRYFIHAGETNWQGTAADVNILDAVLLGSTRIAHGFSLIKHPEIMQLIKSRQIAVEVCPISNQMLHFVQDLRNHPAVFYIAYGLPIVACNDDPMAFETNGVSYDYYSMFMAMTGVDTGLGFLKELGLNSIRYSGMYQHEKVNAYRLFHKQWDEFILELEAMFSMLKYFFG